MVIELESFGDSDECSSPPASQAPVPDGRHNPSSAAAPEAIFPDQPKRIPHIAVVVVHGVGDPGADKSSEAIADLLTTFANDANTEYQPFQDQPIHLQTSPLNITSGNRESQVSPLKMSFHERSQRRVAGAGTGAGASDKLDEGNAFLLTALSGSIADNPHQTYSTVRRDSHRLQKNGADCKPTASIRMFELYWADLSRPVPGAISMLGDLYQIIFHLCRLGRHTIDAAVSSRKTPVWKRFGKLQWAVTGIFTVQIAVLNILLFATVLGLFIFSLILKIPPEDQLPVVISILVILAVGGLGKLWIDRGSFLKFSIWAIPPAVLILLIGPLFGALRGHSCSSVCGILSFAIAGAVAYFLISAYDKPIPGARTSGVILGSVLGLGLIGICLSDNVPYGPLRAGLNISEVLLAALWSLWGIFLILSWLAFLWSRLALWHDSDARDRRAEWTARLTLSSSAAAFLLVTLVFFLVLALLAGNAMPSDFYYHPTWILRVMGADPAFRAQHLFKEFLNGPANAIFSAVFAFVVAALALAGWGFGPVVINDVLPPANANDTSVSTPPKRNRRVYVAGWLDNAYRISRLAGELVFWAIVLIFPLVFIAVVAIQKNRAPAWAAVLAEVLQTKLLYVSGGLLLGSATGLIAFRGRLRSLALGFRPILEAVLDVDNYLRQHPPGNNPRANITTRYTSLLRHICTWQASDARGFDALIILSYSQGTMITTDLLRSLKSLPDQLNPLQHRLEEPDLKKLQDGLLPTYLFTMGCPLRQLYQLRFPHLYDWVDPHGPVGIKSSAVPAVHPAPIELGVSEWVNAFRSDDYVGRALWRADAVESPDAVDMPGPTGNRRELCVGVGCHTHYWDEHGKTIARELDRLIALASSKVI